MKKISILLITLSVNIQAQIIAGDSTSANVQYSNVEENTGFTFIDLDNDGTNDVLFYTEVTEEGSTGIYDANYTAQGLQNNIDFIIQSSTTYDTVSNQSLINKNLNWANGSIQRSLAFHAGSDGSWHYEFANSKNNFMGFRIIYPSDTAYGWILIGSYADSIKSFAIQKTSTGIQQLESNNEQVKVYPNPANTYIRVTATKNITEVNLVNTLGEEVINSNEKNIDISNLQEGVYFVRLKVAEEVFTKKIIIKR